MKLHIAVYKNGRKIGYVKSIAYKKMQMQLTDNPSEAKGYSSVSGQDRAFSDIDTCTAISFQRDGYLSEVYSLE